jgi:hypothetical protein
MAKIQSTQQDDWLLSVSKMSIKTSRRAKSFGFRMREKAHLFTLNQILIMIMLSFRCYMAVRFGSENV